MQAWRRPELQCGHETATLDRSRRGLMRHPIVEEELALLREVNARLATVAAAAPPSDVAVVRGLDDLRETLREGTKTEDQPALLEQWDRQSALLHQLRAA